MKLQTHALALLFSFATVFATTVPWERLDKNDSVLVILDQQTGLYGLARDFDPTLYYNAMLAHSSLGALFDLPVVMTTSAQQGPNGPLPKEILDMYACRGLVLRHKFFSLMLTCE